MAKRNKNQKRQSKKKAQKKISLNRAIYKYTQAASREFSLRDICDAVLPQIRCETRYDIIHDAYGILDSNPLVFELVGSELNCDGEEEKETVEDVMYILRHNFFQDKSFRISPTEHELSLGVLFAGHRFIPFCNPDMKPTDCVLRLNGKEVPKKNIRTPLSQIDIYHTLLGIDALDSIFNIETGLPNPKELEDGEDVEVTITVFDMAEVYSSNAMKSGDRITATVCDWNQGIYDLCVTPASEMDREFSLIRKWCQAMDDALDFVFDQYGVAAGAADQLARAFFMGDPCLMELPGMHIGGYLGSSKQVCIQKNGADTVLWYADQNVARDFQDYIDEEAFMPTTVPGEEESLDEIFKCIGLDLTEGLFEAYMRDELHSGKGSIDGVMERIFQDRELMFYSEEQEDIFQELTAELWEEVKGSAGDESAEIAEYRSRCLAINSRITAFIRSLDRRGLVPDDLPMEQMMSLGQFSGVLAGLIEQLNQPEDEDDSFASDFIQLEQVEQTAQKMMEAVESSLPG